MQPGFNLISCLIGKLAGAPCAVARHLAAASQASLKRAVSATRPSHASLAASVVAGVWMPNLTWLGRRWCLASDDLFVPASCTAAVRSIGGVLLWLQWCPELSPSLRLACSATHYANAAAILLELLVIRQSTRGATVDCDSRPCCNRQDQGRCPYGLYSTPASRQTVVLCPGLHLAGQGPHKRRIWLSANTQW